MGLYLRGRFWWVEFKEHGVKRQLSLRTTDQAEAKLLAEAQLAQRDARKAARVAREKMIRAGALPDAGAFAWAALRWPEMNFREKQAVVFALFKGRCVYCRHDVHIPLAREKRAPRRAVLDHKIPMSGGGSDGFDNITLACNQCNIRKYDGAAKP